MFHTKGIEQFRRNLLLAAGNENLMASIAK